MAEHSDEESQLDDMAEAEASLLDTEDEGENKIYLVECILAERDEGGELQYLLRWTGYPESR